MKKAFKISILIIGLTIIFLSCNKRVTPSILNTGKGNSYDSTTFDYLYVEALRYKLLGNMGDAIELFEECLRINPESDGVYYNIAQVVLANGDLEKGKHYLFKAISIDNENIWYKIMLANVYYQNNQLDSAIIVYENIVGKFPDDDDLKISLGNLYSEQQNYRNAIGVYSEIEDKYGVNETTTINYIRNLILDESLDLALVKALELVENYPDVVTFRGVLAEIYNMREEPNKALEVYTHLIENNPENPDVQISLFEFLLEERRYDDLALLLNKIIVNEAIVLESKIMLISKLLDDNGYINDKGEELLLSLRIFENYFRENDIVVLLRPDLLTRMNRNGEAGKLLEEIVSENNENYYAWESLMITYLNLGDYEALESSAAICSRLFNRSFLAKALYATAATENGNYDLAMEELQKAEILAGNQVELQLQVLSLRADLFFKKGEYDTSFRIFEDAIAKNNNDITILNNYAYYLAEKDFRLKYAQKMAKQVIDVEPNNSTYLDTYGWVLYKRGKYGKALKVFLEIMEREENPDAVYFEHIGHIYKAKRSCELAVFSWEKAISIDPTVNYLKEEIEKCRD